MKKSFLLLNLVLFSGIMITAQINQRDSIPRNMVILEIATGTWCQYCPGAAMGADDLVENGHDVAVIEYHKDDPYQNSTSVARINYYGITSYPTAKFDGILTKSGGSQTQSMYQQYLPYYNQRKDISSAFRVKIYGEHTGLSYDITLVLQKVADYPGTNIVVQLALTESHIPENWYGLTEVNFVEKLMVPNHNGTSLDFSNTDEIVLDLSFNLNQNWVEENCELVAFIQDNSSQEILQGTKKKLENLHPYIPPLQADFTASDTLNCIWADVTFTDQSQGSANYYYWSFPGGTPDTSNDRNPTIYYNEEGVYDVTLTVSNGLENNTTTKEDYMHIMTCTDIEENPAEELAVFPNPGKGIFTITLPKAEKADLCVFDLTGKEIFSETRYALKRGTNHQIDLTGNYKGVYFLQLKTEKKTWFRKIILD